MVKMVRVRTEAHMHHEQATETNPREILEFTSEVTRLAGDTLSLCSALIAPLKQKVT